MLSFRAYAKINLGLRILRRREDGYHDIETVFHRVNIFDEIVLSPSTGVSLSCDNPELPVNGENLCLRAATMLKETYAVADGVHMLLTKSIPVGAGLGGGSSDAATTLLGLNQLWKLNLGKKDLEVLALQLGSDVPFFLHTTSAAATGRGEILDFFDLQLPYWILIAYPHIHVSTPWAYQHANIQHPTSNISLKNILLDNLNDPRRYLLLPNDFEPLILRTYPVVARLKKELYDLGAAFAQMTGSGSSVYGLFATEQSVNVAADELRKTSQVFITSPLFKSESRISKS